MTQITEEEIDLHVLKLNDLLKQATTEKSHYYVASICIESLRLLKDYREQRDIIKERDREIERLEAELELEKKMRISFAKKLNGPTQDQMAEIFNFGFGMGRGGTK